MNDEIFGPVAPISVFKTMNEAIAMSNDSEYGLIAYVYTEDLKKGLQSPSVRGRDGGAQSRYCFGPGRAIRWRQAERPLREGARDGLLEFQETQYLSVDWPARP